MVDGVTALLHLVRTSLWHGEDDEFKNLFLFDSKDLEESDPSRTGKAAAIFVLANNHNCEIRLHKKPYESYEEETIRPGEDLMRTNKNKMTYYCLRGRVDHVYHILEQMITDQSQVDHQDGVGFKVKVSPRRQLEGFDFIDVASDEDPLQPRVTTPDSKGAGWVDFARVINVITLFGHGFEDLFKAPDDSQICPRWHTVPEGLDYLAVIVTDLNEILEKKGSTTTNPWTLVDDIKWHNPETIFEPCKKSSKLDSRVCCNGVQVLLPSRFPNLWGRKYRSPTHLGDSGAVIFGHNHKLPLRWGDSGDPEDEDVEEPDLVSNSQTFIASPDSGIGSSLGSLLSSKRARQPSINSSIPQGTSATGSDNVTPEARQFKKKRI